MDLFYVLQAGAIIIPQKPNNAEYYFEERSQNLDGIKEGFSGLCYVFSARTHIILINLVSDKGSYG